MKDVETRSGCPLITLILVIFCFFSAVFGVFCALWRIFSKIQHEEKWKDYDECGIF